MNYKEILSEKSFNLEKLAVSLRENYSSAAPFPHVTIDNFFSENFMNTILSEFPDLSKIKKSQN